jgi:phosphoribosylformylglycinamidine (FGAM) synthase PurS component
VKQWRFEVFNRPDFPDVHGSSTLESIKELGIQSIEAVQSARVFLIEGAFDEKFADRIANELLTDPVCEQYYIGRSAAPAGLAKATLIEVHLKSGVTDPVAESVVAAIADMGVKVEVVRTLVQQHPAPFALPGRAPAAARVVGIRAVPIRDQPAHAHDLTQPLR